MVRVSRKEAVSKGNDEFSTLQQRLQARIKQENGEFKVVIDGKVNNGQGTRQAKQTRFEVQTSIPAPVLNKNVQPEKTSNTQVVPINSIKSLDGMQVAGGIGLGLLPYLLIPFLLLNAVKGFFRRPDPINQVSPPQAKVKAYTKPLMEGAKEGYTELASGKKTKDLDDIRNGYKLAFSSFAIAAVVAAGSLIFGPKPEQVSDVLSPHSCYVIQFYRLICH